MFSKEKERVLKSNKGGKITEALFIIKREPEEDKDEKDKCKGFSIFQKGNFKHMSKSTGCKKNETTKGGFFKVNERCKSKLRGHKEKAKARGNARQRPHHGNEAHETHDEMGTVERKEQRVSEARRPNHEERSSGTRRQIALLQKKSKKKSMVEFKMIASILKEQSRT